MAVATRTAKNGRYAPFERLLRERRQELEEHLREHRHDVRAEPVPDDAYGEAARLQLEDLAIGTIMRERQMLDEIEEALDRISEGQYGICEDCGDDIPERRLKALPWARLCVPCAERRQNVLSN
jgi:DnaK suppressor protein